MSIEVHRTWNGWPDGTWLEQLVSDNGSVMVIEDSLPHRCLAPELLGPHHFHGTFTGSDGEIETFVGREGGDYPTHLLAAMELDDGG